MVPEGRLRIVVLDVPAPQDLRRPGARRDAGAAHARQRGDTADMVVMGVRDQDPFHLRHPLAERVKVVGNERRRLRQPTVQQNQPGRGLG